MSANRRFFALLNNNAMLQFTIDTRNIVTGATDGSENPLTFRIPSVQVASNSCVIKVNDGRPDKIINSSSTTSDFILDFATAGEYEITVIGRLSFSFYFQMWGYDCKKITLVSRTYNFKFDIRTFYNCSNLVIDSPDVLLLPLEMTSGFQGIKEFKSDLNLIDTSKVTAASGIIQGLQFPLKSLFNPFWLSLYLFEVYKSVTLDPSITKIQIISDSITSLYQPFNAITTPSTIELDVQTPNLTTMFRVFNNGAIKARSHGGKIDVRNVTNTSNWLIGKFTTAQVDATLLGWANNLPFMQSGVTWNWNGSKYSNNPAVIAAYNKITNDWGVIFTNLTMA